MTSAGDRVTIKCPRCGMTRSVVKKKLPYRRCHTNLCQRCTASLAARRLKSKLYYCPDVTLEERLSSLPKL